LCVWGFWDTNAVFMELVDEVCLIGTQGNLIVEIGDPLIPYKSDKIHLFLELVSAVIVEGSSTLAAVSPVTFFHAAL